MPPDKERRRPAEAAPKTSRKTTVNAERTAQQCPCCAGSSEVQWPPADRPACPCALDERDRRPVAMQRRLAYLQMVMATYRRDDTFGEVQR
jgi:hypothetical protein